ncbi:DUF6397 family protein [Streptomyces asoensis]|uniref:DNA-binding protein n=1 Tax=Streptomyces asoensis TaxID=249586 RepID=A0ABQ3RVU3_9ACTN|nr:DUF6397 family protein [Streptomyces asoensis]GGQ70043.1 hypothetical protein GCM10010496_36900 [Streptomyces asoensis]GHI59956.1 hypothetical protein Saso_16060 [Streptomyces asoensis]
MSDSTVTRPHPDFRTPGRAARELELKRSEYDLAVHLGRVRTVPDEGGGGHRVARAEIERLRADPGFPETLRKRVLAVGTREGAALLGVAPTRFTRLARLGLIVPVTFYLNRYRAVVWLYLADELTQFAAERSNAFLLSGRTPEALRSRLAAGVDLRARNWRGRHLGFLCRRAEGPWQRAGALAALLDPLQVSQIVKDPYERSHLNRFRPGPPGHSTPGTPAAHLVEKIATASDPDEIAWLRADLARTLEEARAAQPAPRPAPKPVPAPPTGPPDPPGLPGRPTRGLLSRLRRRGG